MMNEQPLQSDQRAFGPLSAKVGALRGAERLVRTMFTCTFSGRVRGAISACVILPLVSAAALPVQGAEVRVAPGITEPFLDVTLSTAVPGILGAKHCKEGAAVKAGDVLLVLDRNLEELDAERRRLTRDQKKDDFETTEGLFNRTQGISKDELKEKEVEYKIAEVEYEMANERLRRRQILSPLTGIVTEVMLEVGEACESYQPLVRVVEIDRCYFTTNLEAKLAARLKSGQTMKLEIDAGPGPVTVQGAIVFISPVVDPASGLQKVRVLFDNREGKVRPGVMGKMFIE